MLGLCLVAVFAIAAVAATSASALPEWGKCEAQAGGKYKDSNCTEKAHGGEYEWHKGATLPADAFTGHNVGSGGVLDAGLYACEPGGLEGGAYTRKGCEEKGETYELATNLKIECESEENHGEAFGKCGLRNISVIFRGCKLFGSDPCSNGSEEGEIVVNPLKGSIGYINKAEKKVGVLLEPVKKHGAFAQFVCLGVLGTVVGAGNSKEGAFYLPESKGGNDGIISPITPVNTMTTTYEQVYTGNGSNAEPQNVPNKLEGKPVHVLENYLYSSTHPEERVAWSPAAEEITNQNETEAPSEIKG